MVAGVSDHGSEEEAVQVLRVAEVQTAGRAARRVGPWGAEEQEGRGRGGTRPRPAAQASPHWHCSSLSFLLLPK